MQWCVIVMCVCLNCFEDDEMKCTYTADAFYILKSFLPQKSCFFSFSISFLLFFSTCIYLAELLFCTCCRFSKLIFNYDKFVEGFILDTHNTFFLVFYMLCQFELFQTSDHLMCQSVIYFGKNNDFERWPITNGWKESIIRYYCEFSMIETSLMSFMIHMFKTVHRYVSLFQHHKPQPQRALLIVAKLVSESAIGR